jgi:hypothetical protein
LDRLAELVKGGTNCLFHRSSLARGSYRNPAEQLRKLADYLSSTNSVGT